MFDRKKAIDILVEDDTATFAMDFYDYINEMLLNGFKGYNNMSDEELMEEFEARDISYLIGEND